MIRSLTGMVTHLSGSTIEIEVNGIGYEVVVTPAGEVLAAQARDAGEVLRLLVVQRFSDPELKLFGFADALERNLFQVLVKYVSGVGPTTAMPVLGLGSGVLVRAIASGDVKALRKAPGVGQKTAERIVLETKKKIQELSKAHQIELTETVDASDRSSDAIGYDAVLAPALVEDIQLVMQSLGYPKAAIETSLAYVARCGIHEADAAITAAIQVSGLAA